jgi:hypothetical protein
VTLIALDGGNPVNVTPGVTLDLNLVGVANPTIPPPGLPDGTLFSTSHKAVQWVSIETMPIPLGLGGSFDFDGDKASKTQAGFRRVLPADTFAAGKYAGAAGWLKAVLGFDRTSLPAVPPPGAPGFKDLLIDGHWGGDGTAGQGEFQVAVSNTTEAVQVTLTLGDTYFLRDSVEIYLEGVKHAVVGSATGEFAVVSAVLPAGTVTDGFLNVVIRDAGGHSYWTVNALDVRPVSLVADLKLTGPGTVPADGTTVATYTGTGARPNALVTIDSTKGTVLNDVASAYQGVQVQADAAGTFTFQVRSPLSPTALTGADAGKITAFEPTGFGKSKTPLVQDYSPGPAAGKMARYDFDGAAKDTASGFTSVRGSTLYSAADGYGWLKRVSEFERTAASVSALGVPASQVSLYRDGVWGYGANPGKFQVAVQTGSAVGARVYVGDSYAKWAGITVQVEGSAVVPVDTTKSQFTFAELDGSDVNGDGLFWVQVSNAGPGGTWVTNGIDVAEGGKGALPPLPLTAGFGNVAVAGPRPRLADAQLAPIVDAAVARWAATGITADQLAALRAVRFTVADLDGVNHLGEQAGGVVTLDDDGGRAGWFVDATPFDDAEFAGRGPAGVDLLTVVAHELGHVLGYIDLDAAAGGVMAETLGVGERRVPALAATVPVPDWLADEVLDLTYADADDQPALAPWVG